LLGSKIAEFPGPHSLTDYRQNAGNYEALAANSYNDRFIVTNLLCALGCLRMARDKQQGVDNFLSDEIKRIEGLLNVLKTPMKIDCAFKYLFLCFKENGVSFSIHHPQFIEVLSNFTMTLNAIPSEEMLDAISAKWVNTLKPKP